MAAMVAVASEAALRAADTAIGSGAIKRDPGVAAAFIWGLARASEAETEAASALLDQVVTAAALESAEAVAEPRGRSELRRMGHWNRAIDRGDHASRQEKAQTTAKRLWLEKLALICHSSLAPIRPFAINLQQRSMHLR